MTEDNNPIIEWVKENQEDESLVEAVQNGPTLESMIAYHAVMADVSDELPEEEKEEISSQLAVGCVLAGAKAMLEVAKENQYYLNAWKFYDEQEIEEWTDRQLQTLRAVDSETCEEITALLPDEFLYTAETLTMLTINDINLLEDSGKDDTDDHDTDGHPAQAA